MATTSDFILRADASPLVREAKRAETALGALEKRTKDFGADAIGAALGLSRKFENALEAMGERSKGFGKALELAGKGFLVFEAARVGLQIGTMIRDWVTLGQSTEDYVESLEKAAAETTRQAQQMVAGFQTVLDLRRQLAATRTERVQIELDVTGNDVGKIQEATRARLEAIHAERQAAEVSIRTRGLGEQDLARALVLLEHGTAEKRKLALAQYDKALAENTRGRLERELRAHQLIRDAAIAAARAQRDATKAGLEFASALAESAEQAARASGDVGATVRAITRQQNALVALTRSGTADRIAQVYEERDRQIQAWRQSVDKRELLESDFGKLRANAEAEATSKVGAIRQRGLAELLQGELATAEKLRALRDEETARIVRQQATIRDAIEQRLRLETDLRTGALAGSGRSGQAAALTAAGGLRALETAHARETAALRDQLRRRELDERTFNRLSVEQARRASLERIKVRQQEATAVRALFDQAAGLEESLGIKDGLFKGLEQIRKLGTDANVAADAFAHLVRAGVPLDDIFASIEQHGAGFRKRFAELLALTKSNPLLQRALLSQAGDLEGGNLHNRIREAGRGLGRSSLTPEDLRRSIGLVRDDLEGLNAELASADRLFSGAGSTVFVGQLTAADQAARLFTTTALDMDAVLRDIAGGLGQGIPTAVQQSVGALRLLRAEAEATILDLGRLRDAAASAAEDEQ